MKIGLAYSFIEPLESTSLFGVHHGILSLIDLLRQGRPGQFARDLYNHNMAEHTDGWKEFVEAHYYYSSRRDTEYWREVTEETEYDASNINSHDFVRFLISSMYNEFFEKTNFITMKFLYLHLRVKLFHHQY